MQQIAETVVGPIEYRLEEPGQQEGTGHESEPVVLVLNGGHASRDSRYGHEQLTAQGFRVLTPSRPGYDDTPPTVGKTAQAAADAMIALLDKLDIDKAHVIGISAAGPTALAMAARRPDRVISLILECAMTLPWEPRIKRRASNLFGPSERFTWALTRGLMRLAPNLTAKAMLAEMTTLNAGEVWRQMSDREKAFVKHVIMTSRSGQGFMLDLEHEVSDLASIAVSVPVLVIYSPNDKTVPPKHAERVRDEIPHAQLFEIPADSHLIWMGPYADQVQARRVEFLNAVV